MMRIDSNRNDISHADWHPPDAASPPGEPSTIPRRRCEMPNSAWGSAPFEPAIRNEPTKAGPTESHSANAPADEAARWNGHAASDVLAFAELAEAAYATTGDVGNWQRVPGRSCESDSGFKAAVFRDTSTGKVVLAFAGTDMSLTRAGLRDAGRDVFTDVLQGVAVPTQHIEAAMLASAARREFGHDVMLVGHSLGGGLATWASAHSGLRAVTFNAAGLGLEARSRLWFAGRLAESGERITNINVKDEILSSPALLPSFGLAPAQLGRMIELNPAVPASPSRRMVPSFHPAQRVLLETADAVGRLPQRFENHSMRSVIAAIRLATNGVT